MLHFFKSLFNTDKSLLEETNAMKKFLIVGLGNIGDKYTETRHNIGFKTLDALAAKEDFTFATVKLGDVGTYKIKGRSILCLKPSTFMNLSGKAVNYWMEQEKIPLENVLVITDDINLPFGTIRLKTKGSDGGHNGLKDIQNVLQTTNYNRFRFGVGADFGQGRQIDYVLGEWNDAEKKELPERFERASALIKSFVLAGVKVTMNEFNGT
ncbi:peptidyl-tRNA hydrolase [Pricia antarctica]|uniref:Peptidyl-tRNA hydrolase n=1 Tax=Pricia antarctica TaxID=641691 RepID=A0A1G6VQN1_9FLAO|nr:aminoacyl-tRNA hydrolase [Pricia antarctica]SDD55841.1 peptidyl-tRNA hydrolase [Pricia antarctica]